jgi:peptidyl-prolyl cis-trans isomerase B (cyclophilin B)
MDVKLEGESIGTITFELLSDAAPVGAARFQDLVVGKEGVGYRLSRFDGIFPVRG